MAKTFSVLGVAALLLIAASGNETGSRMVSPLRNGILPTIEAGSILRDFHKLTNVMSRMDNLGQMAFQSSDRPGLPTPKSSPLANLDISDLAEAMAPILSSLGANSGSSK